MSTIYLGSEVMISGRRSVQADSPGAVPAVTDPPRPPKLRRRPLYAILGVLMVAVGALGAAWAVTALGHTQKVLAMRSSVSRGEVITAADVMAVSLSPDPALKVVPASESATVVGRHALTDLPAGGLVVAGAVGDLVLPVKGQSLVGLLLPAGRLPGEPLLAGDHVRVVQTPTAQGDVTGDPVTVAAVVVSISSTATVSQASSGDASAMQVTVTVPTDQAAKLAAIAASGRAAIVKDPS